MRLTRNVANNRVWPYCTTWTRCFPSSKRPFSQLFLPRGTMTPLGTALPRFGKWLKNINLDPSRSCQLTVSSYSVRIQRKLLPLNLEMEPPQPPLPPSYAPSEPQPTPTFSGIPMNNAAINQSLYNQHAPATHRMNSHDGHGPRQPWTTGLCDCCKDPKSCKCIHIKSLCP